MDWFGIVLLVGLSARLVRLAVVDDIAEPVRFGLMWSAKRLGGMRALGWAVSLTRCPHCIGFWLCGLTLASFVAWGHTGAWRFVAGMFALSYVVGHAVALLDMGDDDEH